ncbi:MAG TPA: iron ABC transporter permease [Anaerolineaceae bacterium]|nr:iron ABC transporter permease [Anaerolineaceae bacterium]
MFKVSTLRFSRIKKSASIPKVAYLAGMVALFAIIPIFYILIRATGADVEVWQRIIQTRLITLMSNTILLVLVVTTGTVIVGVSMAWLTERTNLPGRRIFRWILALPLAIPAYIGAIIHLAILRPRGGLLPQWLDQINLGFIQLPNPTGFWGAAFVLTIFSFPYVFLLTGAAFRSLNASFDEAARMLGRSPWQTFWHVTLPVIRPGIAAGALLVALDILAEYGTVALLRFETFSSAIFVQLAGRYDRSAASILSGILILLALVILFTEFRIQQKSKFTQIDSNWRPAKLIGLGKFRIAAFFLVLSFAVISFIIPIGLLIGWSISGLLNDSILSAMQLGSLGLGNYVFNSFWSSALAALIAVVLSLPVAIFVSRHPGKISFLFSRLSQVGYAIPGVVVALSLVLLVNQFLPFLYATPMVIVMAYVVRYIPQAVRSSEATISQLSVSVEEAARLLKHNPVQTFINVTLPLILPGLLAGSALVFMSSLKELPATLLLRPAGFETLAVRVWIWSEEGFYFQAAPAALLLVITSIIPLYFLLRREAIFKR